MKNRFQKIGSQQLEKFQRIDLVVLGSEIIGEQVP
jgi:hypothetical protein